MTTAEHQALKARARRLWQSDRAWLLTGQPFIARLAMRLSLVPVIDDRVPTACTDGRHAFVNARWLLDLSADDRRFVLVHEVWHCVFGHLRRAGHRHAKAWNIAADHEVNTLLIEAGLRAPDGAVFFRDMAGRSAEVVYEWLLENGLPDGMVPLDTHGCPLQLPGENGERDPDYRPVPNDGTGDDWDQALVEAAAHAPGSVPGAVQHRIDRLKQPTLPWQTLLQRFVARSFDRGFRWTPPNRRFIGQGLYLPGQRGERLDIAVAVDTSGSTRALLPAFAGELQGILKSFGRYRLRVIHCDAAVRKDIILDERQPLPDLTMVAGGGGTDFRPVFERLAESPPAALVFLTDGFGPAPTERPAWPTLWVTDPGGKKPANWGECIRITGGRRQT